MSHFKFPSCFSFLSVLKIQAWLSLNNTERQCAWTFSVATSNRASFLPSSVYLLSCYEKSLTEDCYIIDFLCCRSFPWRRARRRWSSCLRRAGQSSINQTGQFWLPVCRPATPNNVAKKNSQWPFRTDWKMKEKTEKFDEFYHGSDIKAKLFVVHIPK